MNWEMRVVKGNCIIGLLATVMKGRNVSIDVKRSLRSILMPTFMYRLKTWILKGTQQSRMHTVESSYLRMSHGVKRREDETYKKCE